MSRDAADFADRVCTSSGGRSQMAMERVVPGLHGNVEAIVGSVLSFMLVYTTLLMRAEKDVRRCNVLIRCAETVRRLQTLFYWLPL